jgi:selenocysteine-specific elongation factor
MVDVVSPAGIKNRGSWTVHLGTAKLGARLSLLQSEGAAAGDRVPARLTLAEPQPVAVGDRFLLWDTGRQAVAGGGVVLNAESGSKRRRIPAAKRADLLAAVHPEDISDALVTALIDAGGGWRPTAELRWLADLPAGDDPGRTAGPWSLSPTMWHRLAEAANAVIASKPRSSRADVTAGVVARVPGVPDELVHRLLEALVHQGALARVGTDFVAPSELDALVADRAARADTFLDMVRDGGLEPPDVDSCRRQTGLTGPDVARLADEGRVILSEGLGFDPKVVAEAVSVLHAQFGDSWFPVTDARQLLDIRRRYALALLHALDRSGSTERREDDQRRFIEGQVRWERPEASHRSGS